MMIFSQFIVVLFLIHKKEDFMKKISIIIPVFNE